MFLRVIKLPHEKWKALFSDFMVDLSTYKKFIPPMKSGDPVIDFQADRISLLVVCDRLNLSKIRHIELHSFEDYLASAFFRE